MSDLLNQASLVMIPSGYKEDTVYSVVPSDGSGDLSFTRASNGTRINSAGLVEVVPWDLIDNSNSFTAGAWVLQEVTTTSGQSDPLGGSFGWRFNETTATNQHRFYYSFIAFNTGVITQSIYVKSLGRDQIFIGANSNAENLIFTFSTETISSVTGFTSTSATNVGGGWYRITATFFGFSPINCLFVQGYNGGLSYAGDTAKGFYAFGGQLNIGSTAKPYFPTTDRLNVPRLTYQNGGGGCPSLLLEKQSTNLQLYSEDFRNVAEGGATNTWTPNDTIILSTNNTAPDGTLSATRIRGNGSNRARQAVIFGTSGAPYSGSIFIRRVSGTANIELRVGDVSQVSTINPTSDWQRFTHTASPTSTAIRLAVVFSNNTDEFEIWGAQLEASSYPTSYIPTTSSSATRVADACSKTGISSLIGQTEGAVFYDGYFGNEPDEVYVFLQKSGSSGVDDSIYLQRYLSGIYLNVYFGSTTQALIGGGSFVAGQRIKIAAAYKANDFVIYINGGQISFDTSGSVPTCSNLQIGTYAGAPSTAIYMTSKPINEVILFPTRLTNAELASLTTI